ncbi:MAG: hypothetical protein JO351_02875 [Candidatus Eremiobacteraeota bacterium]|nr:hypothetical protein [Candidatus Eremiobacteraeota bacterium]
MVQLPVASLVSAISSAAARWADPHFAARQRLTEAVSQRTGYSEPVVDHAFDTLFGSLRREAIEAVIADELGCLKVLDEFSNRPGRPRARALPLGKIAIVSSRTTVGVAIVPAIFALCAKCTVHVKDRDDSLVRAFFETVKEELPELAASLSAEAWDGEVEMERLRGYDGVVAFGNDHTLSRISRELPHEARFIGFGSKASAGYITRQAREREEDVHAFAARVARDVMLYDTEGCLSLHVLLVEPHERFPIVRFSKIVADAVTAMAPEFPASDRDAQARARQALAREAATFALSPQMVQSDTDSSFLVVADASAERPPPFVPRSVAIWEVDTPAQAARYLRRHGISLEGLAIAQRRDDVVEMALQLGVSRITELGMLQRPPLGYFHGGRPRIAEFVRWVSDET